MLRRIWLGMGRAAAAAVVSGLLAWAVFVVMGAGSDGIDGEDVFYGSLAGLGGALAGAVVGFVVGVAGWGPPAGALAGTLGALAIYLLWSLAATPPERWAYFLRANVIVPMILAAPCLAGGAAAGWLNRRRRRRVAGA